MDRPDLSKLDPQIRAYIEMLESELEQLKRTGIVKKPSKSPEIQIETEGEIFELTEPNEPPTTINIITATASGVIKRTPRHFYTRQKRGGMGIFDLETPEEDPPILLAEADESQSILFLTDHGRAFQLPLLGIPESPVRSKGLSILSKLNLANDEQLAVVTPIQAHGYLAVVSQRGFVRLLRHHIFGEYMKPGTQILDPRTNGMLSAVCWTGGEGDLFIATRSGKAIRFAEKLVAPGGTQGIRLDGADQCIAIAAVDDDSLVFLLGADGKGTVRFMENFNANKSPNAGGKVAMNTDQLIAARTIQEKDDIFIISQLSKIIRFRAEEVPPKDGVVQGVVCMSLRADNPAAVISSTIK